MKNFIFHFMLIKAIALSGGNIWGDLWNLIKGNILQFMANFIVPAVALVAFIIAFVNFFQCLSIYKNNGGGRDNKEFWDKVLLIGICVIFGIAAAAIWGIFASYI